MPRYDNILQTIGNTPLVRLNKLAPPGVNVYVKVESFNPLGSVKDRMARAVIEHAERTGELKPGQTVIEATSGNTGIGLAMVCAQKGYPLVVDDGGELQPRAAQAAALPRRPGRADACRREGHRHAEQGRRARREARLVPVPAVRERGQRRGAHAHDGPGDPRRLRGRNAARVRHRASARAARCSAWRAASRRPTPASG